MIDKFRRLLFSPMFVPPKPARGTGSHASESTAPPRGPIAASSPALPPLPPRSSSSQFTSQRSPRAESEEHPDDAQDLVSPPFETVNRSPRIRSRKPKSPSQRNNVDITTTMQPAGLSSTKALHTSNKRRKATESLASPESAARQVRVQDVNAARASS